MQDFIIYPVGYQNKGTRESLNYFAPTFCTVTATDQSFMLQDVQMDEDAANYSTEIRVLSANQQASETYVWFKKRSDGTAGPKSGNRWDTNGKNGLWFLYEEVEDEAVYTYNVDAVKFRKFDYGTAFEISADSDERKVVFSGSATDATVAFPLHESLNYVGNPYPVDYKLQGVNMDEDAANYSCEIRVLSANQQASETYVWFKKRSDGTAGPKSGNRWDVPEGMNGIWFLYEEIEDEAIYTYNTDAVKNRTFGAGDGVELSADSDDRVVTFTAPFELNPAK